MPGKPSRQNIEVYRYGRGGTYGDAIMKGTRTAEVVEKMVDYFKENNTPNNETFIVKWYNEGDRTGYPHRSIIWRREFMEQEYKLNQDNKHSVYANNVPPGSFIKKYRLRDGSDREQVVDERELRYLLQFQLRSNLLIEGMVREGNEVRLAECILFYRQPKSGIKEENRDDETEHMS